MLRRPVLNYNNIFQYVDKTKKALPFYQFSSTVRESRQGSIKHKSNTSLIYNLVLVKSRALGKYKIEFR